MIRILPWLSDDVELFCTLMLMSLEDRWLQGLGRGTACWFSGEA